MGYYLGMDPPYTSIWILEFLFFSDIPIYCRMPARRGLQQTAQAATRHGARDPLVRPQVDKLDNHLDKNFKRNEPHI